ncbi:MAG: hypothetical protein AAF743_12100 [Planctomycetota bacterium]
MSKAQIGGGVVLLVGVGVIALEWTKPTVGGWLWWIVGLIAIVAGAMNVLNVGRADGSDVGSDGDGD